MIARELVTRLSFIFDKVNLSKFERYIVNIKNKTTKTFDEVSGIVTDVFDRINERANKIVAFKDLADYSNQAIHNLKSLQLVAQKFSIPEENFTGVIKDLTLSLREAQYGFGKLFEFSRESFGRVTFRDELGNLKTATDVIFNLAEALRDIPDVSTKLLILERFPGIGAENAANWLRLLSLSNEEIQKAVEGEREFALAEEQSIEKALKLRQETQNLATEWDKFTSRLAQFAIPITADLVRSVNEIVEDVQKEGLSDFIGSSYDKIKSLVVNGNPDMDESFKLINQTSPEFRNYLEGISGKSSNVPTVINNDNTINITVPNGTSEEVVTEVSESVKYALNLFWQEKVREISNNNPTVE